MKKIKSILDFINNCPCNLSKTKCTFYLLRALFLFPAFVFHEIMHFAIAIPFGWDLKIVEFYFFKTVGNSMKTYRLNIQWTSTSEVGILGSAAPLIGWIIALTLFALSSHWFFVLYFILAFQMFFLSEEDIATMKADGFNEKACELLMKLHDKIKPGDVNVKDKITFKHFLTGCYEKAA